MKISRLTAIFLLTLILLAGGIKSSFADEDYPLGLTLGFGLTTLNGGAPPWFGIRGQMQLRGDVHLWKEWRAELSYSRFKLYDDYGNSSELALSTSLGYRTRAWSGYDLGVTAKRRFYFLGKGLSLATGLGGGLVSWKMSDPGVDTLLLTTGLHGASVPYKATEIFLSGALGLEKQLNRIWRVGLDFNVHYLTGLGRSFDTSVEDALGKWNLKLGLSLSFLFGGRDEKSYRMETVSFHESETSRPLERDSVVFVPSSFERIRYASVSETSVDSDRDGVPDLDDDCPGTPIEAAGLIDIRGCPIDSDADGVPDYRDRCPDNLIGARVDNAGCPYDSDRDGVPDGLDDCPGTEPGMEVDQYGCVNLDKLKEKLTLHIRYREGSFEIDHKTRPVLDSIAVILEKAPNITVEINAYTDDAGKFGYNKTLSQRRANRIRDYLESKGIAKERLVPIGRGETNFIARNDTASGRQLNRRVELIFMR